MIPLSGRFAPDEHVRTKNKKSAFRPPEVSMRRRLQEARSAADPFQASFPTLQPNINPEMTESVADTIIVEVAKKVPPSPRHSHKPGSCETAETSAAKKIAWDAREDARRLMRIKKNKTAWKKLKTACANLPRAVDAASLAYSKSN